MRATRVPPKLEQPKTTAGLPVGPRELAIVGPACGLAVLLFFSGLPFFMKVGMAVGGVGLSGALALIRVEGRHTIEEYLLYRLGYAQRVRRRTRGGAGAVPAAGRLEHEKPSAVRPQAARPRSAWFTLPAEKIPPNRALVANAVGLALLSAFIAWLGADALGDLMLLRANILHLHLH